ncbi:hypothetical protein [Bradyrhizobium japonicum]|uniref:hypothetical protein n=1 Tax=Bradyrhizobium japonicum TaxID=375 RepID=UPI00209E34D0|nr:hypothetical protein [Bradyrhizobium japonicum]MCP1776949.1 hypothetical protein [Bradyrhizobium japonicum]MCP1960051.1 hypothetical protein [Bradyrhizobium japonicum]
MDERTNNPTALVAAAAHGPLGPTHTPIKEHRTFTCLLVEDDDAVRILVANYLEENDVRVICASRLCDVAPLLARNQSWPRLFGQRPAGFKWIPAGLC